VWSWHFELETTIHAEGPASQKNPAARDGGFTSQVLPWRIWLRRRLVVRYSAKESLIAGRTCSGGSPYGKDRQDSNRFPEGSPQTAQICGEKENRTCECDADLDFP
jgi:hypothetical protein